jgi:hypothetical protein
MNSCHKLLPLPLLDKQVKVKIIRRINIVLRLLNAIASIFQAWKVGDRKSSRDCPRNMPLNAQ